MKLSVALAALLLTATPALLAGCSSTAAPSKTTPAAAVSGTPTEDLRPWASAVAAQSSALEQLKASLADSDCDAGSANEPLCGAKSTAATFQAKTIAIEVEALTTSGATTYIGSAPSSISDLYDRTKSAASAAASDGEHWSDDCIGSDSRDCLTEAGAFTSDLDDLTTQFAAWAPYS